MSREQIEYNVNADLQWIRENEKALVKKYSDKYIVVRLKRVRAVYDKNYMAVEFGLKKYGKDNFVVFHVLTDEYLEFFAKGDKAILDELEELEM